jgi:hypothetical protein
LDEKMYLFVFDDSKVGRLQSEDNFIQPVGGKLQSTALILQCGKVKRSALKSNPRAWSCVLCTGKQEVCSVTRPLIQKKGQLIVNKFLQP